MVQCALIFEEEFQGTIFDGGPEDAFPGTTGLKVDGIRRQGIIRMTCQKFWHTQIKLNGL